MKRISFLIVLFTLTISLSAQETFVFTDNNTAASDLPSIEIMPFGGYMFGGNIETYRGIFDIKGNANYGITIGIPIKRILEAEISYFRMDTEGKFRPYQDSNNREYTYNMDVQYMQIGATKTFSVEKVKPFTTFSLGATCFENKDDIDWKNLWAFSVILGAGFRMDINDLIALRLQGRFMMPLQYEGAGFCFGTGGTDFELESSIIALQGDFSAGLIFKIY